MIKNHSETHILNSDSQTVLSISELTANIKEAMELNFTNICVQGEISEYKRAASGHIYMTLKDERAVLNAIIWRSVSRRIKFDLEEGLEVVCKGSIDIYPPRGSYQLIIRDLHPCGLGPLQLAFKQLVSKLEKEGLFAAHHKKALPAYPQKIGIITSASGAAIRDMIRIIQRRWPVAEIYILPTPVQGEAAAVKIAEGIKRLNEKRSDIELIIIGRGGGSLEDLWAFNEECVARAVFDSKIPIVSAVGHEVDFSVSDFVADMRAATPSEAGEKTVPNRAELIPRTDRLAKRLGKALYNKVVREKEKLESLGNRYALRHPESLLQEKIQKADETLEKIKSSVANQLERKAQKIDSLGGKLEALNPKKVLKRGYSITFGPEGKTVQNASSVRKGDSLQTFLQDGVINSTVEKILKETNENH